MIKDNVEDFDTSPCSSGYSSADAQQAEAQSIDLGLQKQPASLARVVAQSNAAAKELQSVATQTAPTAEQVCRMLELMSLHIDGEDKFMSFVYRMTHIREGVSCRHEGWIEEFHRHAEYWENANKAPADKTKRKDLEYPGL